MATYIVMTPPRADPGDDDQIVFVKDAFTWLAFIVPVLWFAFHRMWLWAAGFLVVGFALSLAADQTRWSVAALALELLVNLWAGLEAGTLRVAGLQRRGWREADVIVAPGRAAAEDIHFATVAETDAIAPPPLPAATRPRPPLSDDGPALGLFDHGGR